MKPISFKDVVEPDFVAELSQHFVGHEPSQEEIEEAMGLPQDYLTQTVELSFEQRAGQPVVKPKRFGHGSTAEGPDEVNL